MKYQPLPGIRTKFRTDGDWVVASLDVGGALLEVGRLNLLTTNGPGDPSYQEWVDTMSKITNRFIERVVGLPEDALRSLRRKAKDP